MKFSFLILAFFILIPLRLVGQSDITITGGASLTIDGAAPNQADVCADGRTGTDGVHFIFNDDATWCSVATPVTLVSFDVELIENNKAKVTWTTSSEINNDYFLLHKSYDLHHWEVVAKIDGHGTTNAPKVYSFYDGPLYNGMVYYQLEQRDYDGTSELFDIKSIEVINSSRSIAVYPNPSPSVFEIEGIENSTYSLVNRQGQVVKRASLTPINKKINLSDLPQGIYFLNLKSKSGLKTHFKLIKAD